MSGFPAVAALVPHAGPMCLLEEVLRHDDDATVCTVRAQDSALLGDARGRIGSHVALEWMAQCIAVHGGLLALATGAPPRPGLFLGSRRARLPERPFQSGERFEVGAQLLRGNGLGPHAFACTLRRSGQAELLAEGTLNVMIFENLEALTATQTDTGQGSAWR